MREQLQSGRCQSRSSQSHFLDKNFNSKQKEAQQPRSKCASTQISKVLDLSQSEFRVPNPETPLWKKAARNACLLLLAETNT